LPDCLDKGLATVLVILVPVTLGATVWKDRQQRGGGEPILARRGGILAISVISIATPSLATTNLVTKRARGR